MARPDLIVECEETVDRPPGDVWATVTSQPWIDSPSSASGEPRVVGHREPPLVQVIRPSPEVFMEQRIVGREDQVMVLRFEMTRSRNLPWCAYQSTLRVGAAALDSSRVVVTALVTPAAEPDAVTGILRGLILLWLRSLKAQAEKT